MRKTVQKTKKAYFTATDHLIIIDVKFTRFSG